MGKVTLAGVTMDERAENLCTKCGLCCDGSLFAEVELASAREGTRMEAMGLRIEDDDDVLLAQPCGALKGKRCGIYRHRPKCCRNFECRLLQQVKQGQVSFESATATINETARLVRNVKRLLNTVHQGGKELSLKDRCVDALDACEAGRREELEMAMARVERRIAEKFLGEAF